eukprot:1159140-Pelagomonas_calceolata.AAC.3
MGGVPLLMSVLQEDRDDLGLMRGALECFVHAMRLPPSLQPQQQDRQQSHLRYGPAVVSLEPNGLQGGWGSQGAGSQQQTPHPYQQLLVPHAATPTPASTLAVEAQVCVCVCVTGSACPWSKHAVEV